MTSTNLRNPVRTLTPRDIPGLVALTAASLALVAAFLPWGRSGQTSRTSFELIGVADRLDVLEGNARHMAMMWFLLPVLVGSAWVARSLNWLGWTATLSLLAGALAMAAAAVVQESPLAMDIGADVARWSGLAAVGAAVAHLAITRSHSSD